MNEILSNAEEDLSECTFDLFKQRNKSISKKDKEDKQKEKKLEIDEKTMATLQSLIDKDSQSPLSEEFKTEFQNLNIFSSANKESTDELIEESEVLVHRPNKNFVWGLGQQTKRKKTKFIKGEVPSVESLVEFLEEKNMKNIIVVPTHKLGLMHLKETCILCTGHTTKHIYNTAKELVVELKKLNIPGLTFTPTVFGRRDEEWLIVEIGEVMLHFFTTGFKEEFDLLEHWLNPTSEDYHEFCRRADAKKNSKKNL